LLQLAERVLEVAALALLHGLFRVPEADRGHLAVLGQGTVPGNESGLVTSSARYILRQSGRLSLGVFPDTRDGQARRLRSLVRLLVRLHLADMPGGRLGEDVLKLGDLLLVVAAGLVREQGLLRLPQTQEDGLPLGIEAKAQSSKTLLLSRSREDRLGDHLGVLALLRVDRPFRKSRVHQTPPHTSEHDHQFGSRDGLTFRQIAGWTSPSVPHWHPLARKAG